MNKRIISLIVIIVFGIIALFAFNSFLEEEVVDAPPSVIEEEEVAEEYVVKKDSVVVPDQAAGNEIFVERVELLRDGYVVIHRVDVVQSDIVCEDTDEACDDTKEVPGAIIGASTLLEAGVHENKIVTLNEGEVTEVDERVIAMIHTESSTLTENVGFSPAEDAPSKTDGAVVMVMFTILSDDAIPGFETKL